VQGEPEAEGCRVEGLEGLVQEGCPRLRCTECREKGGQGGGLPGCVLCGRCLCCCLLFSCCLSREREVFVCCLTAVVGFVRAGLPAEEKSGCRVCLGGPPRRCARFASEKSGSVWRHMTYSVCCDILYDVVDILFSVMTYYF